MNNYQFCAQWVLDQGIEGDGRVLDYGCGVGKIVSEMHIRNINAFGCDVFYDGGRFSHDLPDGEIIRKMEGGTIPFTTSSFDIVINNQVMEHVEDLNGTLAEIYRVLKPGGLIISLFPDKGVYREGHCGIPFLSAGQMLAQ